MRVHSAILAALAAVSMPIVSSAANTVYSDDFNTDTSANYFQFVTKTSGATPSGDATWGYDYSALGIPSAPGTFDGTTLGLRLRTDNLGNTGDGNVIGVMSVVTKNVPTLSAPFTMVANVWGNYIGGTSLAASGSNGTTYTGAGIGASGTKQQSPLLNEGALFATSHDGGGGDTDYRAYTGGTRQLASSGFYAAGTSTTSGSASTNHTASYYSFLGSHTAPSAQTTISPSTQGGSTPVGIIGFAWHTYVIQDDGTNVKWFIDNTIIATVPVSSLPTFAGSQVSLTAFDSATGGNTAANNQLLNADIWDNLTVYDGLVPEPTSLSLIGLGGLTLLQRRRKISSR